ncbi:hypothetical protein ATI61_12318 [Archangium gephyra]|nr:hypothetical protein [Archangium gephyra]REG19068.1 hypothetical protein ATI61_12318 [Archangium gephyra]
MKSFYLYCFLMALATSGCFLFRPDNLRGRMLEKPVIVDVSGHEFKTLRTAIEDTAKTALQGTGLAWGGINVKHAGAVTFHIIDAREYDRQCDDAQSCSLARKLQHNCVAFSPTAIACDLSLLWLIHRDAVRIALSTLLHPETQKPLFPRAAYREQFFRGERISQMPIDMIAKMKEIDSMVERTNRQHILESRNRILRGFLELILFHEFGHIVKKHIAGRGAVPSCALDARSVNLVNLCQKPSPAEEEADTFALTVLSRRVDPTQDTPERYIAEWWIEEYQRANYEALADCWLPLGWKWSAAPESEKLCFYGRWLERVSTGSHPAWFRRYLQSVEMLESRGVTLPDAAEAKTSARTALQLIEMFCSSQENRSLPIQQPGS